MFYQVWKYKGRVRMDRDILSELFEVSSEQINCVNGAELGTGLIRFSEKIS